MAAVETNEAGHPQRVKLTVIEGTEAQCTNKFDNSGAALSCNLFSTSASGDDCTFSAQCGTGDGWNDTSITVDIDDADDLVNCSGSLATSC